MLYVQFQIFDLLKFKDFQNLYKHLHAIRQPGFKFEEIACFEDEDDFFGIDLQELKRYQKFIPKYANSFLEKYQEVDNEKLGNLGIEEVLSIFNYLEFGFEVNFDDLQVQSKDYGVIYFSTGNFPFGGLERFFITLKAFDLIVIECFDGFTVNQINWISIFEYEEIELIDKTKEYLKT